MLEETATTEELENSEEEVLEVESAPIHPYDLPGEWFVLNAQSGHEKKVRTNILTRIKNLHLEDKVYDVVIPTEQRLGKKDLLDKLEKKLKSDVECFVGGDDDTLTCKIKLTKSKT